MRKTKHVRVAEKTHQRLKKRLAEWIAKTGNPNLTLGELIESLLDKTRGDSEKP